MIYFCADDYGVSAESNTRIEECLKNGILNKCDVRKLYFPTGNLVGERRRAVEFESLTGLPESA